MIAVVVFYSPLQAAAGTHVGVQVELLAQGQVQGAVTLADRCHQGTLQSDFVPVHAVDGRLGDSESAVGVLQKGYGLGWESIEKTTVETHANGGNIDGLPLDGHASDAEDLLDSGRNLGSDTISRDQGDLWSTRRKGPGIDGGLGHLKEVTLVI